MTDDEITIDLPDGVSEEQLGLLYKKYMSRGTDYTVLLRYPLQRSGSTIHSGSLEDCREFIKDLAGSEPFPVGTLLYISVAGALYEGYEVTESGLRKIYKKYPVRVGRSKRVDWGDRHLEFLDKFGIKKGDPEWEAMANDFFGED